MKMSKSLAGLVMMAAMFEGNKKDFMFDECDDVILKKEPPIPKGCKQYFFNKNGGFSTEQMLESETVFKCIAYNDKSAKKKFTKWESKK